MKYGVEGSGRDELRSVLMSFDNAVSLRDAVVQARAEGGGEAQLRARLIVRK